MMIEIFNRLLQQHEDEEKFIEYLKKLRSDIEELKEWANKTHDDIESLENWIHTDVNGPLKSTLELLECKQIEDREDTTEQLDRIKTRLDHLEEKKK